MKIIARSLLTAFTVCFLGSLIVGGVGQVTNLQWLIDVCLWMIGAAAVLLLVGVVMLIWTID